MGFKIWHRIFLAIVVVVSTTLFAFLLKDILASYVFSPFITIFQIGMVVFHAVPRIVWWILLLIFLIGLIIKFFPRISVHKVNTPHPQLVSPSRMSFWINWIERSKDGDYSNWFLTNQIATLIIESIAYRNRQTYDHIRWYLKNSEINLPREIEILINAGLKAPTLQKKDGFFTRIIGNKSVSISLDEIKLMVDFLEEEIGSGG